MRKLFYSRTIIALLFFSTANVFAQDKEAKITLSFDKGDSINTCEVQVTSNDSAVAEVEVKLYVQRMFSLLPIGGETTDDDGMVSFEFPNDIPADQNGKLIIIAKIEDDENYANTQAKANIDWGVVRKTNDSEKMERSLSAAGDRAPIFFIVVANTIVIGIWGTLIYVIFQLFKIKKASKHLSK